MGVRAVETMVWSREASSRTSIRAPKIKLRWRTGTAGMAEAESTIVDHLSKMGWRRTIARVFPDIFLSIETMYHEIMSTLNTSSVRPAHAGTASATASDDQALIEAFERLGPVY